MLKIQERTQHMEVQSDVVPKRNRSRELIGKQSWEKRDERAHRTRNKPYQYVVPSDVDATYAITK